MNMTPRPTQDQCTEFIARTSLFASLPSTSRSKVCDHLSFRSLPQGTVIGRQNEPQGSMHFILGGLVRRKHVGLDGQVHHMEIRKPPDALGSHHALTLDRGFATTTCASPVDLYSLSSGNYRTLLRQDPDIALTVITNLHGEIRRQANLLHTPLLGMDLYILMHVIFTYIHIEIFTYIHIEIFTYIQIEIFILTNLYWHIDITYVHIDIHILTNLYIYIHIKILTCSY